MDEMKKVYGIDLGTTNSCIAYLDNMGNPRIITDEAAASDTLASAIYIDEANQFMVGAEAKEMAVTNPETTFQFWKRYIGRDDIPNTPTYMANGVTYDPVSLSTIVLEKIIRYAKDSGEEVENVVITCPAYFDFGQREATKQAGQKAGLNVLAVLNEPTAAAMYYCANRFQEQSTKVLVYDLGGGTFDVSIIEVARANDKLNVNVLATDGDFMLGGYDWDMHLYDLILEKYAEQYGVSVTDIDEELCREFRGKTEEAKQKMSRRDKAVIKIAYEGDKIQVEVTREEFENVTRHRLEQTVSMMNSCMSAAGLTDEDLDVVLMVGGSTIMPQVQEMLHARFGEKVQFNEPNLAVAKGAVLVANALVDDGYQGSRRKKADGETTGENPEDNIIFDNESDTLAAKGPDIEINDISPRSFGLGVLDDWQGEENVYVCDNIVLMDEVIPCNKVRSYATPRDNMRVLRLRLFESKSKDEKLLPCLNSQGEEVYVDPVLDMKCRNMLEMIIPDGYDLPRHTEVVVNFSVDEACNVRIVVTVPDAGNATKEAEFSFYKKLTQEEIDEAVKETKKIVFIDGD